MENHHPIRVRYAPAPTGRMHIGNVRSALMPYIFAHQKSGSFIVRIEDTDQQRNFDPQAGDILADIAWLGLSYDEGPEKGGPYAPYFQSQRTALYQEYLQKLQDKNAIYRCFCSQEELERKRLRQQALKQPPRYDRTCMNLSPEVITHRITEDQPFIWRLALPEKTVAIYDLARGTVTYDLKHFSDCPLTRQDGSFTFIFANFVDDLSMHISHVFRGEEHFSNTATQAALYQAFETETPIYWHMPLICDARGKKLSKRDFGFSLNDLRQAGYLPSAINNYLAIIGSSFNQEIMGLDELVANVIIEKIASTGHIKYDLEKLRWINHQWIQRTSTQELVNEILPLLVKQYPEAQSLTTEKATALIDLFKKEMHTLHDASTLLSFYFNAPTLEPTEINALVPNDTRKQLQAFFTEHQHILSTSPTEIMNTLSAYAKSHGLAIKPLYILIRFALSGTAQGLGIKELLQALDAQEVQKRLAALFAL